MEENLTFHRKFSLMCSARSLNQLLQQEVLVTPLRIHISKIGGTFFWPAKITLSQCQLYKVLDHSHNMCFSIGLPGMHINEVHHARENITDRRFGDALETWKEIW